MAMKLTRVIAPVAVMALAGCGRVAELRPIKGHEPVKPLMARAAPTTEELLTIPPYAQPNRVDELVKRSEPRRPDPFDLPPPTGSSAPALPAGTDPMPVANDTGPATPK
jgi:hypothetical protein